MSRYTIKSRVVYCKSEAQAVEMTAHDPDSRALLKGPGTLSFHLLIAQQGAGEFTTLHVPPSNRGKFAPPCGAEILESV